MNLIAATIAAVAMLSVFLPVVAGPGGIAGTQTVTPVVRRLALGETPHRAGFRLMAREPLLSWFLGFALTLLAGLLGWVWKGSIGLGLAIRTAMVANLLWPLRPTRACPCCCAGWASILRYRRRYW